LYQELILDHSKKPRCFGKLSKPDVECALFNPLCGDQIELALLFKGDRIEEIAFSGHGCSISQAAASMMAELLKGKTLVEVKELSKLYQGMIKGEVAQTDLVPLGDIVALQGVKKFSTRIKCAMLAWEAIDRAIRQYEGSER
jgi:nitrogen fixation protein NifU and related proteins